MNYFLSENNSPVKFISCGNLISKGGFVHPKRNINSFVILFVNKGVLPITQNNVRYELKQNEFLILFPSHEHYGHRPCEGELSYFWCHFHFGESNGQYISSEEAISYLTMLHQDEEHRAISPMYLLPEHIENSTNRANLFFNQLLDLAKQDNLYSDSMLDFATSLLLMEISQNLYSSTVTTPKKQSNQSILQVMEWIKINYNADINVNLVAETFNYNPDYLSTMFRRHTGVSLLKYINKTKISVAKQLLTSSNLSIKEIAMNCGYSDEKHFMKSFKKLELITPTQYRYSFFRKKLNKT